MKPKYEAKVKFSGNHYHAGETVRGSKIRQLEDGRIELYDDEENYMKGVGDLTRYEYVQVAQPTVMQDGKPYVFTRDDQEPLPEIDEFSQYLGVDVLDEKIEALHESIGAIQNELRQADAVLDLERAPEVTVVIKGKQVNLSADYVNALVNTALKKAERCETNLMYEVRDLNKLLEVRSKL